MKNTHRRQRANHALGQAPCYTVLVFQYRRVESRYRHGHGAENSAALVHGLLPLVGCYGIGNDARTDLYIRFIIFNKKCPYNYIQVYISVDFDVPANSFSNCTG